MTVRFRDKHNYYACECKRKKNHRHHISRSIMYNKYIYKFVRISVYFFLLKNRERTDSICQLLLSWRSRFVMFKYNIKSCRRRRRRRIRHSVPCRTKTVFDQRERIVFLEAQRVSIIINYGITTVRMSDAAVLYGYNCRKKKKKGEKTARRYRLPDVRIAK